MINWQVKYNENNIEIILNREQRILFCKYIKKYITTISHEKLNSMRPPEAVEYFINAMNKMID